jgi:hypothetical protein
MFPSAFPKEEQIMHAHFQLQPPVSELPKLADQFCKEAGDREQHLETAAFEAGSAIRNGETTLANLEAIVRWKSERAVHYLIGNSTASIRRALEVAAAPEASAEEAISALLVLHGVDLPIASAILTAIFPERYTVMDCQVLEALGYPRQDIQFYEDFLAFCNHMVAAGAVPEQGTEADMPLRRLDRALRQWSENQTERQMEAAGV